MLDAANDNGFSSAQQKVAYRSRCDALIELPPVQHANKTVSPYSVSPSLEGSPTPSDN